MNKQSKLTNKTKDKLKKIIKSAPKTCFEEDAKFAIEIKGELTGQIAIQDYNKWIRS